MAQPATIAIAQSAAAEVKFMNRYEAIMWEKEMKEQILCHAHALCVESYPQGSVFNVIQASTTDYGYMNEDETLFDTHLVVYKAPSTAEKWELVFSIDEMATVEEGLDALLGKLRSRLGNKIRHEKAGKEAALTLQHLAPPPRKR